MDEPAAHLDLANKRRLMDVLSSLAQRGVTIVLTTHEPDFAAALASYLVLIRQGRLVAHGSVTDVFREDLLTATYGIPLRIAESDGWRTAIWK
jgi:iron complex transport system ATP-binding protein